MPGAFWASSGSSRDSRRSDPVGQPLILSEDLFKDAAGAWETAKSGRGPYMPLLAQALKEPDEIWWRWRKMANGQWSLRRRYLARLRMKGVEESAMAVFEHGKDGWQSTTIFPTAPGKEHRGANYLRRWRGGLLAWRRG